MDDSPRSTLLIVGDVFNLTAVGGALLQILPPISALLAIIWYLALLYDSRFGRAVRAWFRPAHIEVEAVAAIKDVLDKARQGQSITMPVDVTVLVVVGVLGSVGVLMAFVAFMDLVK